ncbi:MAG TPA: ABC transporter substrate-binding protein [Myxococcaceae bacterium]|nr:ABC transporter substrate-binding protein [Myxococcaceae bacterium]
MIASLTAAVLLTAASTRPLDVVRQGNDQVQDVIGREGATVEQLANKVDGFVDFGELARRALGKDWQKLTPAQQKDFTATMKDLLRTSYAQRALGQKASDVTYENESLEGKEASVLTSIAVKASRYPVEYKLYRPGGSGSWKIYDVVTDEVSLVQTYRDQFRRLIASKGYNGLLVTLKSKRDQLERTGGRSKVN